MNAISIQQPTASAILSALGPVRHLAWQTTHRGPLLIHVSRNDRGKESEKAERGSVCNAVIGVVELADCVQENHPGAGPDEVAYYWVLTSPRVFVRPLKITGKVGLFQVSDSAVAAELARARAPGKRKKRPPHKVASRSGARRDRK
jgi:hypothetical protein